MNHHSRVAALLTDFGTFMGYVGQMKGVLLSINPELRLVDLSHDIPPQNVRLASVVLQHSLSFFPTGTIYVAVVDPGVGSGRPGVIVESDHGFFVGPDNGLFGFLQQGGQIRSIHRVVNDRYFLENRSNTFHGRDVFAPVAGYLSLGYPADEFGPPTDGLLDLAVEDFHREGDELIGEVLAHDAFGNVITSFSVQAAHSFAREFEGREVYVFCQGEVFPILRTFSDAPPGDLLAYAGSFQRLEIAENHGNAMRRLGTTPGVKVKLIAM